MYMFMVWDRVKQVTCTYSQMILQEGLEKRHESLQGRDPNARKVSPTGQQRALRCVLLYYILSWSS